jgi:hypothetical protein
MSIESAREYAKGLADNLREDTTEDAYEWMECMLDYEVTYNSQKQLVSVRVLVTFGGPNAWIVFDGKHATVQASWYSDMVEEFVPDVPLSAMVLEWFDGVVILT